VIGLVGFLVTTHLCDRQRLLPTLQNIVEYTKPLVAAILSTTAMPSSAIDIDEEEPNRKKCPTYDLQNEARVKEMLEWAEEFDQSIIEDGVEISNKNGINFIVDAMDSETGAKGILSFLDFSS
jgi:hypothetical protein